MPVQSTEIPAAKIRRKNARFAKKLAPSQGKPLVGAMLARRLQNRHQHFNVNYYLVLICDDIAKEVSGPPKPSEVIGDSTKSVPNLAEWCEKRDTNA